MFSAWKEEKALTALIDEAQAMADKLETTKPHIRDSHAATARFWQAACLAEGQDLHDLAAWPPANVTRFVKATQTRIAALRKSRDYDSSDGLAVWLHTARAVLEPRIAPPARLIWQHLMSAGPNAAAMAEDLAIEATLVLAPDSTPPRGFDTDPQA
ncbi:hypothetical protein HYN69_10025 [Gemmobacter aquarius]|uniref:Uncharacterized protein n=1 Tax=Paragemmobacter aquarius TaxID=2169400 RepID=A0A2S0ULV5_9RHOB|nr:hypothetical protein [Gemmobacter aquarius]AWB48798.1 hypothetical protein HYN69_10025 [Gemmobacter aquarius]